MHEMSVVSSVSSETKHQPQTNLAHFRRYSTVLVEGQFNILKHYYNRMDLQKINKKSYYPDVTLAYSWRSKWGGKTYL